jgi:hypothetical protein
MSTNDSADELYRRMQVVCHGYAAADVVFALGKMMAFGILNQSDNKNPDHTFKLLRAVVNLYV